MPDTTASTRTSNRYAMKKADKSQAPKKAKSTGANATKSKPAKSVSAKDTRPIARIVEKVLKEINKPARTKKAPPSKSAKSKGPKAPAPSNLEFSDAIVFFADMLGFSHQVTAANSIGQADALVNVLKRFADEFTESNQTHGFFGRKYWAISDSMIAVWDMSSPAAKVMGEFDAILSQLSGLAFAQGRLMITDKQLVRGGVGRGWFKEVDDTVVSPALVQAAGIEKKIESPFIGVSPELVEYFNAHRGRTAYAPSIDPMADLFIPPSAYTNSLPALDYFLITLNEINLSDQDIRAAKDVPPGKERDRFRDQRAWENQKRYVREHRDFITAGLASKTGRVREKYAALREHHNFRVLGYFKEPGEFLIP